MTWLKSSGRHRCGGSSPVPHRGSRTPTFGDAYCSPECARWKGAATWRSPEMRITHVVARAFGPFHGERLDVAPGMTVVTGPNESGKSSWHAALRLALTGLRRGRGRATAADAANAKGPLRLARLRLAAAREAREVARSRHAEHLEEQARLEASTRAVREIRLQLDVALATQARHLAVEADLRATRAAELTARYPERPMLASRDRDADLVAAAITTWDRRPAVAQLEGPSSERLQAALDNLPEPPVGDFA